MYLRIFLTITLVCAACNARALLAEQPWSYVVPDHPSPFGSPLARGYRLNDNQPPDVEVSVEVKAAEARFTQVRYGSLDSVRVAMLVVTGEGPPKLYVDANRDRKLDEKDFIDGPGPKWQVSLPYERTMPLPEPARHVARTVTIRLHRSGKTVSMATAGYLEGPLELDGKQVASRMVDVNVNGRFGDTDDRLWIDLDGDGNWDRFQEQFPSRPVVRVAGRRFSLVGDTNGQQFSLSKLTGTGTVAFQLVDQNGNGARDYRALLVGQDQTAVAISKQDGAVEVPVGRYRVANLAVTFDDTTTNGDTKDLNRESTWNFTFGDRGGDNGWIEVEQNQRCEIQPLTGLKLHVGIKHRHAAYRPGESVSAAPRLYSATGLSLNSCTHGELQSWQAGGCSALVELRQPAGQVAAARSGFA